MSPPGARPAKRGTGGRSHDWTFPPPLEGSGGGDLLRWPVVGRFLGWKHARTALQVPVLFLAVVMVLHGLFGPRLAPRNLASLLTWVHFRGFLVLGLLVAGNAFCMACPFVLVRDLARRVAAPVRNWPRRLRGKWVAVGLFVAVLFSYEAFDLWGSPWWTAWLIVGYFAAALVVDSLFRHAPFCKYVCPLGQFNFLASTISPLEVRIRSPEPCLSCETLDCIKGTRAPDDPGRIVQRGCELALFQPLKQGNLDCTFCLDCVQACPHDNVTIGARLPGAELWSDARRSGVGRVSRRPDLGLLALVFTFGAILNAFAMVSPAHALGEWIGGLPGMSTSGAVLAALFMLVLVVEPVVLLGAAAWTTRRATGDRTPLAAQVTRFAFALLPLGLGIWAAHYAFHFLTGLWTVIPVTQAALGDLGVGWLGEPAWRLVGVPPAAVLPFEMGLLGLGLVGSLLVTWRIAERDFGARAPQAFAPWATLCLALWIAAAWLMMQPMEMRGTVMGG